MWKESEKAVGVKARRASEQITPASSKLSSIDRYLIYQENFGTASQFAEAGLSEYRSGVEARRKKDQGGGVQMVYFP